MKNASGRHVNVVVDSFVVISVDDIDVAGERKLETRQSDFLFFCF